MSRALGAFYLFATAVLLAGFFFVQSFYPQYALKTDLQLGQEVSQVFFPSIAGSPWFLMLFIGIVSAGITAYFGYRVLKYGDTDDNEYSSMYGLKVGIAPYLVTRTVFAWVMLPTGLLMPGAEFAQIPWGAWIDLTWMVMGTLLIIGMWGGKELETEAS